jgi:hypothetical protein
MRPYYLQVNGFSSYVFLRHGLPNGPEKIAVFFGYGGLQFMAPEEDTVFSQVLFMAVGPASEVNNVFSLSLVS